MPTRVSATWPPLKRIIVGIARTPYSTATASFSSMFTFAMESLPFSSVASSSKIGAMALHGPHHGAQKSTRTGVVAVVTADLKVSVVRLAIFSDIGLSVQKQENGKQRGRNCRDPAHADHP